MITVSKYVLTIIITAIFWFAVYSFIGSFSLAKKLNYYKHANQLIADTFSKNDEVNDEYQRRMYNAIREVKTNGALTNEEIDYINKSGQSYNITKRLL